MSSIPDILNDKEIFDGLSTKIIGKKIVYVTDTVSTNSAAFKLAEQGAVEGTVFIADSQSGGKGRMGRTWTSPPGVNIYCSIVLRPSVMPYEATQLTFLSSVAVAITIESLTDLKPMIKWPNDLLICNRKVAGLLNEMSSESDAINFVILGIGVNLNMRKDQFPDDLRQPATSLFIESGQKIKRAEFVTTLLNKLDILYSDFLLHGFEPVRREWIKRCNADGSDLLVTDCGTEIVRGRFTGIDTDGALLVCQTDGSVMRIFNGDVRIL